MKNLILIILLTASVVYTNGQTASAEETGLPEQELQAALYDALHNYVDIMKKMGTAKSVKQKKYKNVFTDWNKILVEDFYVPAPVSRHPQRVPSDLYASKFVVNKASYFARINFSFPSVKFYYNMPVKFKPVDLSVDAMVNNYFAGDYFSTQNKYNDYFYIRTGIEVQGFKGKNNSEDIDRSDNVMIHWIFKKNNTGKIKDLKIISIHNYGEYSFENTLPDNPPVRPKPKHEFPGEKKEEALAKAKTFLESYLAAFDAIPKSRQAQNDFVWKYYSSLDTKVATDITTGEENTMLAKTYIYKLAQLDSLKQQFAMVTVGPEVRFVRKHYYELTARTKAQTSYALSDSSEVKNEVLLNMVVRFKYKNGQFSDFKINNIIYKNNDAIHSQIITKKIAPPVEEEEENKPGEITEEIKKLWADQAWLLANKFLITCSRFCRGATVDQDDFQALFDDAENNNIEIISCWTRDTLTLPIVGYLPHLDSLDYTSKYFVPVKTGPPGAFQYDPTLKEWYTYLDIEHKFTGFDNRNAVTYNDFTVKRVKAIVRTEGLRTNVVLQNIIIVANECLPPVLNTNTANRSGAKAK